MILLFRTYKIIKDKLRIDLKFFIRIKKKSNIFLNLIIILSIFLYICFKFFTTAIVYHIMNFRNGELHAEILL